MKLCEVLCAISPDSIIKVTKGLYGSGALKLSDAETKPEIERN